MKFDEAKALAANKGFTEIEVPKPIYKFYSYKDGICKSFDTKEQAQDYSPMIESYMANREEYDNARNHNSGVLAIAYEFWYDALQQEYNKFVELRIFDIVFQKAYDREHAYGYDAVADEMKNISSFVNELLERIL